MSEKTVLITGATSGIGMEAAYYLHEQGYRLLLIGRNEEKLKLVSKETGDSNYYVLDLEETERIAEIAGYCMDKGIHLDGMIHAAGYGSVTLMRNYHIEEAAGLMKIHYLAFIELCKCLYSKRVLNDNSSIIALSSMSAIYTKKGSSLYSAAKSALNAAVKVASVEFAKKRIRVNAIMPAYVDTRMIKEAKKSSFIEGMQPFGIIPVRDVAYTIEFLLSDKSKYITGALIPISAGMQ